MQSSSTSFIQAMIVAVGDSKHFLVGVIDENNNLIGLGQSAAEVVDSLGAAKAYLRGNNIFSALLELETINNDLATQSVDGRYRQRVLC